MRSNFQSGLKGHWRHLLLSQHSWAAPRCPSPPAPSEQHWCPHSPQLLVLMPSIPTILLWRFSLGSRAVSASSCLLGAPWGTIVPLQEENQNVWNCACSRCLVGGLMWPPGPMMGSVRAILWGCASLVQGGCSGSTHPLPTEQEHFLLPLHFSSSSWRLFFCFVFFSPDKCMYQVNDNFKICHQTYQSHLDAVGSMLPSWQHSSQKLLVWLHLEMWRSSGSQIKGLVNMGDIKKKKKSKRRSRKVKLQT